MKWDTRRNSKKHQVIVLDGKSMKRTVEQDVTYKFPWTRLVFGKGGKEFDGMRAILRSLNVNETSKAQMWTPPEYATFSFFDLR